MGRPISTLTHSGRLTHICLSKLTITGSDNGTSRCQRQAIIWTNAGILPILNLEINFMEILREILTFSFKKMHLNTSSAIWWQCCLGLSVLTYRNMIYTNIPETATLTSHTTSGPADVTSAAIYTKFAFIGMVHCAFIEFGVCPIASFIRPQNTSFRSDVGGNLVAPRYTVTAPTTLGNVCTTK